MGSILLSIIFLCCKCAAFAALITLDIPLAVKVLLGVVFGFMWMLLIVLGEIEERLGKIHLYARLTFTTLEMHRRTPGSQELAWDRLNSDVKFEQEREEILNVGHSKVPTALSWGLELVFLTVGTFVFYFLFQIMK